MLLTALLGLLAATLPQVLIDTTYITPPGSTTHVASGGNLQTAITNAACGDIITLEAGATFTGNFTLPDKDCDDTHWVYISTDSGSLPAAGTRVAPADASNMAKLTAGSGSIIASASDADHYRFIGIEITPSAALTNMIDLSAGDSSLTTMTNNIIFDRCYLHGHATNGTRRGIAMNGATIAVVDSYLSDFKEVGADSQALAGWTGPGPFKIVNNYLEGAGENVIFGGGDPTVTDLVPSDIEIRRNHVFKPLTWKEDDPSYLGTNWAVKNLIELKNAQRVLIEHNTIEHNWAAAQSGFAVLFTVRNQNDGAPWSVVQDVVFRYNILRHASSGINILAEDTPNVSEHMQRIDVNNNVLDDISEVGWGGSGWGFQLLAGPVDLVVEHNTMFPNHGISTSGDDRFPSTGFIFRYNITAHGGSGFTASGQNCNNVLTEGTYFTDPVVDDNVIQGAAEAFCGSAYPGNTLVVDMSDVGFDDFDGGDYRLDAASDYYQAAPGNLDYGACIPCVGEDGIDPEDIPAMSVAGIRGSVKIRGGVKVH